MRLVFSLHGVLHIAKIQNKFAKIVDLNDESAKIVNSETFL